MKTETYLLPDFWASALINDDYSGMADLDAAILNEWLDDYAPGVCLGCTDEPEFTPWHDASQTVGACNCLTYTFATYEETTA